MARDRLAAMRANNPVQAPYDGPSGAGFTQSNYQPIHSGRGGYAPHGDFGGYGGYEEAGYTGYDAGSDTGYRAADDSTTKLESRISLGPAPGESTYELTSFSQPSAAKPVSFWDQISEVQALLTDFQQAIGEVRRAQEASLSASGLQGAGQDEVEHAVMKARNLANKSKVRIQQVATQVARAPQGTDSQAKSNQVSAVKSKFKELVQQYTEAENGYRAKLRARAERQFRIVKPDASEAEMAEAIDGNDANGGVFAQALMTSNRHGQAANALREVQDRHAEIRKIEETMAELAQLFNDVDVLLTEQDVAIDAVTSNAQNTYQAMETGHEHTNKAVTSARKARKKRWICFWIIIVVLIIVVVAVVATLCTHGVCSSKSSNENNNQQNTQSRRRSLELDGTGWDKLVAYHLKENDPTLNARRWAEAARVFASPRA